jgi:hypothetical protein
MKKYLNIYAFVLVIFCSCQEEVRLELKNMEKIPVIEAIWTNRSSVNKVVVTYSRDYYDTVANQTLTDAEVSITNLHSGNQVRFMYVDHLGHYLPLNNQVAEIGKRYRLEVKLDGKVYFSEGEMLEPPVLDSVTYAFSEQQLFRNEGYYVTVYGKIPFDRDNYYRVKVIRNDTLLNRRSDYLLFDDSFGTSILDNGFELAGFAFEKNDKVKLQLYRLNKAPYDYLNQLVNLLFNDGGLFSPPPQNPTSNIYPEDGIGRIGGYFLTSPVLSKTVYIDVQEK